MHRDIGFNRIIDMIIVIELNRETSADLHPYYLTLLNYLPIYPSTIQLCTQISTYLLGMGHDFRIFEYSI